MGEKKGEEIARATVVIGETRPGVRFSLSQFSHSEESELLYLWVQSHSPDGRGDEYLCTFLVLQCAPFAQQVLGPWVLLGLLSHLHTRVDLGCLGRGCHEEGDIRAQRLKTRAEIPLLIITKTH